MNFRSFVSLPAVPKSTVPDLRSAISARLSRGLQFSNFCSVLKKRDTEHRSRFTRVMSVLAPNSGQQSKLTIRYKRHYLLLTYSDRWTDVFRIFRLALESSPGYH